MIHWQDGVITFLFMASPCQINYRKYIGVVGKKKD